MIHDGAQMSKGVIANKWTIKSGEMRMQSGKIGLYHKK
jgi:hypothetical protein